MTGTTEASTRDLIFTFLVQYKRDHNGNSPTTREIAEAYCLSSLTTVRHHLMVLAREGRIIFSDDRRYNVEIVGAAWHFPEARDSVDDTPMPDTMSGAEGTTSCPQGDTEVPRASPRARD